MKKDGSILIEVMISVFIIISVITIGMNFYITNMHDLKQRILKEEIDINLYNLSNEIKYNIPYVEIEELLDENNEINLKYDENFSKMLVENNFEDLEKGKEIKIIMISNDEKNAQFEIEACVMKEGNKTEAKYKFNKSWWMDEI